MAQPPNSTRGTLKNGWGKAPLLRKDHVKRGRSKINMPFLKSPRLFQTPPLLKPYRVVHTYLESCHGGHGQDLCDQQNTDKINFCLFYT